MDDPGTFGTLKDALLVHPSEMQISLCRLLFRRFFGLMSSIILNFCPRKSKSPESIASYTESGIGETHEGVGKDTGKRSTGVTHNNADIIIVAVVWRIIEEEEKKQQGLHQK